MNKDESIITQVAAKIAADLVSPATVNIDQRVGEWAVAFDTVLGSMFGVINNTGVPAAATPAQPAIAAAPVHMPDIQAVPAQVEQVFPNTTAITVQIKGKAHGDVPAWLVTAAAAKGVSTVWDERDKLSSNPKRPWFRSTEDKDVCFWPPRG